MINRFYVACSTCGQRHTLRITLGYDRHQEHTFSCVNCGEDIRVGLELDFEDRVRLTQLPWITTPKVQFQPLENCVAGTEEGVIVNLDPTFLVPEELLHQDRVFPWMYEAFRIGYINKPTKAGPFPNDAIDGLGGERNLREKLELARRAWDFAQRGHSDLCGNELTKFARSVGLEKTSLSQMLLIISLIFLGPTRQEEAIALRAEVAAIYAINPDEVDRFRMEFVVPAAEELLSRFVGVIKDYLAAYSQLVQALLYARRDVKVGSEIVASSKDLRRVKMFYGECFEQLSNALVIPACLNNIKSGRPYDQFETMTLKKYLTLNKANRAKPFEHNKVFRCLCEELDSVIRNASHHGGMRVKHNAPNIVEYRSGDSGQWRTMPYAEFLWRCNRIMLCLMKVMILTIVVLEGMW